MQKKKNYNKQKKLSTLKMLNLKNEKKLKNIATE